MYRLKPINHLPVLKPAAQYHRLLRETQSVQCTKCTKEIYPTCYHKHLQRDHSFSPTTCCWCENFKWMEKCGLEMLKMKEQHRLDCFTRFVLADRKRRGPPSLEDNEEKHLKLYPKPLETKWRYNCVECDSFYKKAQTEKMNFKLNTLLPECFVEDIPIDDMWLTLLTDTQPDFDSSFGFKAYWLRLYLADNFLRWYHFSIEYTLWPSFLEFAKTNQDLFCVLPNWCLCNGGNTNPEDMSGQHRHIILVLHQQDLQYFFKKIKEMELPNNHFYYKRIYTQLYLINAVNYVSTKNGQCHDVVVFGQNIQPKMNEDSPCHYYVNSPLPPHGRLMMGLIYPNGFKEVVEVEKRNILIGHLETKKTDQSWFLRAADLYNELSGHVIPWDYEQLHKLPMNQLDQLYYFVDSKKVFIVDTYSQLVLLKEMCNSKSVEKKNSLVIRMGHILMEAAHGVWIKANETQHRILDEVRHLKQTISAKDDLINTILKENEKMRDK